MRILVLNRSNLATTPYLDWLGAGHEVVLLTSTGAVHKDPETAAAELAGYQQVVTFDRFHENPAVETAALDLHRLQAFDSLIAMNEFDLLRAARLREAMHIAGQEPAEAEAYRDKLRMKELLSAAGIPVAPFARIAHATALHTFVAEQGYPVVVKPRRGAGSMGVEILRTAEDLTACLEANPALGSDDGAALLAEKYIEHDLFHIDGIIVGGTPVLVWPSACSSCLAYRDGTVLSSAMLDAGDPLTESLQRLTLQTLEVLSSSPTLAFHAEAFLTPDGDLLLNEIACRVGGGKIYETIRLAFGVDLVRTYVQAIGDDAARWEPVTVPQQTGGFAIFPGSPGTLVAAPDTCPVDGVDQYRLNVPVGTVLGRAEHSSARIASVVVAGRNRAEAENSLEQAVRWFSDASRIEPTGPVEEA